MTGAGAALILIVETALYQLAVVRGDQSFNALVPASFAALLIAGLWPLRRMTAASAPA